MTRTARARAPVATVAATAALLVFVAATLAAGVAALGPLAA